MPIALDTAGTNLVDRISSRSRVHATLRLTFRVPAPAQARRTLQREQRRSAAGLRRLDTVTEPIDALRNYVGRGRARVVLAFCGVASPRAAGAGMCIELHAWAAGQAQLERPVECKAYVTAGGGGAHAMVARGPGVRGCSSTRRVRH